MRPTCLPSRFRWPRACSRCLPTPQLVELAREHAEYGPRELQLPSARRRLRVLGELAENVAFVRHGFLPQAGAVQAAAAQQAASQLLARVSAR